MDDWIEYEAHREYHPAAQLFPLLEGPEFEELKADIAANGLIEPIYLHPDGTILDGRNRHRACIETGTRMRLQTWDGKGSAVQFVVSKNLHRRHLSSSQRAAISLDALAMLEAEAKKRQEATQFGGGGNNSTTEQGKARDQAAALLNTNPRYVQDAKKLRDKAPDLLDEVRAGKKSIPQANKELVQRERGQAVGVIAFSSESNEYYTPLEYIEAARAVMGEIDLDPASHPKAQQTVRAKEFFTQEDDGLKQDWHGRVWLNPPYGKTGSESNQGIWAQYLKAQHEKGHVSEAILLVKAAVGYQWFEELWDIWPVCFARERLSFIRSDGDDRGQSKQGTAFFYLGNNVECFIHVFTGFGRVILVGGQCK